jgi:hypothetical protein
MDPRTFVDSKIRELKVTRSLITTLAGEGLHRPDLANWLNGHGKLSQKKIARLLTVVADLEDTLQAIGQEFPLLELNLKNPIFVAQLIASVKQQRLNGVQMEIDELARIASRGLEAATCSVSEQKEV